MKLAELLEGMPEALRTEIGDKYGWDGRGAELGQRLRSPEEIGKQNASLYDLERSTLTLLLRRFGCAPFDYAKLEKAGQKELSGAAIKVGLIRLSRKGIVFALRRKWGETDYVLPEDTFAIWRALLLPCDEKELLYAGGDAATDSEYRPGMAAYLLFALSYLAKEDVTITQKGGLHKRHAGRLSAIVPIPDSEAAAEANGGSAAVSLLLTAAQRLGLLEQKNDRLTVSPGGLNDWFARTEARMNSRLYDEWKRSCGLLEHTWLQHACCLLERLPEESWISIASVCAQLKEVGPLSSGAIVTTGADESGHQAERLSSTIRSLAAWGWAETGCSPSGERLFRWIRKPGPFEEDIDCKPDAGAMPPVPAATLFVQPDFELIATPDCKYDVRWELEMIAQRVRHEHIAVYRITRESMLRAFDEGRTAEQTVAFLEKHAKFGVPDHVRTSILQWGDQQSQLQIETKTVLTFRDERTAQNVLRDEHIGQWLGEALGPAVWEVRADKAEELRAYLTRSGYSPGSKKRNSGEAASPRTAWSGDEGEGVSAVKAAGGRATDYKGLIYSKPAVKYYDSERIFSKVEDVYPGLQEIPPMWLKDCRTYHLSTRKEIVQKALEWKALLKLRTSGRDTVLIPVRMDGTRDDWAVTGFEQAAEVRLAPDGWEEMQLILPGIND
ncbi:helicase-associated domain-containing protein [Paenibacillus ginsengarvi]|uniref:Helicase XPB/Ssl2 N-terminal domain-containing protein n=1 Tax=Paenibacillus ginsengarvi TaxID=400777 RepID=A0A3B0CUJ7_9BACL|nr:helicase-associated domain-containing protein [Paenibacillus ginsengarvi]RKN86657.1 hypothetical protein D7M11_01455 [Paenibacillus ginsengarvi]